MMNNNQQPYEERTVINLDTFKPTDGQPPVRPPVPDGGESLLSPLGELAAIVGDVEAEREVLKGQDAAERVDQVENTSKARPKEVRF